MNILAISSRHPPYHFGGYELRIKNILDEFHLRGHTLSVITTIPEKDPGMKIETSAYPVYRKLHVRLAFRNFLEEIYYHLIDLEYIDQQIRRFRPDVIYLGHTNILVKVLLSYLAGLSIPIVYDEGGSGLIDAWEEKGRWFHFANDYRSPYKLLNWLRPLVVELVCRLSSGKIKRSWSLPAQMQVIFNSNLNSRNAHQKGVPLTRHCIIHSGIDSERFHFLDKPAISDPVWIIVPGRWERRKGQLDALQLLDALIRSGIKAHIRLIGEIWDRAYADELKQQISQKNMTSYVSIVSMLSHESLVNLYHQSDFCFFPSYFGTGFSRVPLEAMACGSLVLSYGNEGSDEIIRHGENGFLFKPGALDEIVKVVRELYLQPERYKALLRQARHTIEQGYSLPRYVDSVERVLIQARQG